MQASSDITPPSSAQDSLRRANPTQAGNPPRSAHEYGAKAPDPFDANRSAKGLFGRVADVLRMALGRDDDREDYECANG